MCRYVSQRMWLILAVIAMSVFTACSDDEPKADDIVNQTPEQPDKTPEENDPDGDDVSIIDIKTLSGTWKGVCFIERGFASKYESLTLTFNSENSGTMVYENVNNRQQNYKIYNIAVDGNTITCTTVSSGSRGVSAELQTMKFEMRGEQLYPVTSGYEKFVLARDAGYYTDAKGEVIENKIDMLLKLWVNDNGMNIMNLESFSDPEFYQLAGPKSGEVDYYMPFSGPIEYEYLRNVFFIEQNDPPFRGAWEIVELTENTLVVRGGNTKQTDTYHVGSEADIPCLGNVADAASLLVGPEVFTDGDKESSSAQYDIVTEINFEKDDSVEFAKYYNKKWGYRARGTYKTAADKLELDFTTVEFFSYIPGYVHNTADGFIDGTPRKITSPLYISVYGITLQFPDMDTCYLTAKYNGQWTAAR